MPSEFERKFFIPRETLDTFNSLSWFFADAFWMMEISSLAYALLVPTILSGVCLVYIEKRVPVFFINLAILSWIFMNSLWMISDISEIACFRTGAIVAFGLGLVFIGAAFATSRTIKETFSHFKRFRTPKWTRNEPTF